MVSVRILIEGQKIQEIASAVKGIDEKLGNLTDRFSMFGESAKRMDNRLAGIDKKLETLPNKIAQAINPKTKKQQ